MTGSNSMSGKPKRVAVNDLDIEAVRETIRAILDEYPEATGLVMLVAFLHTVLGIGTDELVEWVETHDGDGRPGPGRFLRVAQVALDQLETSVLDEPSARQELLRLINRARSWLDLIEAEVGDTLREL